MAAMLAIHPELPSDLAAEYAAVAADHETCRRRYEALVRDAREQLQALADGARRACGWADNAVGELAGRRISGREGPVWIATATWMLGGDQAGAKGGGETAAPSKREVQWRRERAALSRAMCDEMAAAVSDILSAAAASGGCRTQRFRPQSCV